MANCNLNDEHVNKMNPDRVPDVVRFRFVSFFPVLKRIDVILMGRLQ